MWPLKDPPNPPPKLLALFDEEVFGEQMMIDATLKLCMIYAAFIVQF